MEERRFDKKYANRAMILFAGFAMLVLYIETMLVPSLPSIARQYNIDAAEVSLVVSMYLVSGVALSPIVGKLGDIYGKKRILWYVLPVYLVAVGLTGFSPNFLVMVVARTIQGVGLTVFALLISLVQEEFPKEMVPRAMAIIVAMFGIGSAVGLPLGSFVSNYFGWQYTYHTALPFVAIFVALILYYIRESRYSQPKARVDYLGAAGLGIALAMIVLGLSEGTSYGWNSLPIAGLLVLGFVILALAIIYEGRVKEPILDKKLLSIKNVMSANLITVLAGLLYFFAYQSYAYLFESPAPLGFGLSIFQTGLAIAPFAVANAVVAPIAGRYIPKYGVKPFFIIGSIIGIIGFLLSTFVTSFLTVVAGIAVVGLGVALVAMPTVNLLVLSIDRKDMGLATSMNSVFRFLGSALGAPVAGLLIAVVASSAAFVYSFYIAIACLVATIAISFYADEIFGKNRKVTKIEKEVSI